MNHKLKALLPFLFALALVCSACNGQGEPPTPTPDEVKILPLPSDTPASPPTATQPAPATEAPTEAPTTVPTAPAVDTPTPEPSPTLAPEPTEAPPQVILFQDDFGDPDSGWEHYRQVDGVLDYEEGGYRMWADTPSQLFWVNAGLEAADVRIDVDATRREGPAVDRFGVLCRLEFTNWSYYAFLITSDGRYGVGKVAANQLQLIGMDDLASSGAINQGLATNHLRADCVGDTLTLTVNGEMLVQVQDDSLASGDVGLLAGTFDEAGADILFDNLVVYAP